MRHEFLVLTVKKLLKSVSIYGSYRKNNIGVPFFGPPCTWINANDVSRSSPIDDRRYVFSRLRVEKERSAVAVVTCKGYKNASSPVNRVCGRIPRIPPESATGPPPITQAQSLFRHSSTTSSMMWYPIRPQCVLAARGHPWFWSCSVPRASDLVGQ